MFEVTNEENTLKKKMKIHKDSVRSIEFNVDGSALYSASVDRVIKITDVVSVPGSNVRFEPFLL